MSNFLKEMSEIGEEYGRSSGGTGFVTLMAIEFGFYLYADGHDKMAFWKRCETKEEAPVIKAELVARLNELNISEEPDFCMHIYADKNILGRDAFEWDGHNFHSKWQWQKKDNVETCYTLIVNAIDEGDLPLGEKFWGRYLLKANPYHVAQGEDGKKEGKDGKKRWPSFILPVEKFVNEAAAKAFLEGQGGSTDNSKWSELAIASYGPDMEAWASKAAKDILEWVDKVKKGEVLEGYSLEGFQPMNPSNAKKYIARAWAIEAVDIDQLTALTTPF